MILFIHCRVTNREGECGNVDSSFSFGALLFAGCFLAVNDVLLVYIYITLYTLL